MKIRFGIGLGADTGPEQLAGIVTKFVIRPALPANVGEFIDRFVAELIPRQN